MSYNANTVKTLYDNSDRVVHMKKYNVPHRKYCRGKKIMVSVRIHEELWEKVKEKADRYGWSTIDVVSLVLDQYVQQKDK